MKDNRPAISEGNARHLPPEMRAKYRVVMGCGYCWEDDRNEACPDHGYEARQIQRIDTLEADNARLRALVKDAEGSGDRSGAYPTCPWCQSEPGDLRRHDGCPAFTTEGKVK